MIPQLLARYPEGSDITIMNTYHQYGIKGLCDEFLVVVYKDNKTGKKDKVIIKDPEYTYYVAKPNVNLDYNRLFIERNKVDEVTVPFKQLEKSIAEHSGNEEFYKVNIRDRSERRKLHTARNIFFSDSNIEDHYRFKFAQMYTNNIEKLNKAFFDIEVEGKYATGDFVDASENCPINCVSFMDEKSDKVYTYILRNSENPLIQQFENEIASGQFGFQEIHDFVVNAVGGLKAATKYNLLNTQFELSFYDDEIELIKALFRQIHVCSPDFVEGWNSSAFDLDYIIGRCMYHNVNPADVLCDQSWEIKTINNYVDVRHINDLAERGDFTFISGLPVFIDQMIQYASRRKSKIGSFKSFKLDDIGEKEAKVKKLDYHHITHSVTELPWLDFKTFVLYNIMDVVVQKCIETNTNDLEYIFAKCINNNTVYNKGHRQTIYLINRMASEWYKMGYIIGNNVNRWNEKPPKYLGALVGNPLHTDNYSKLTIDGRPIWICDNLQDYDYKSLYPSIMIEFNIAPNTQVGRIMIDHQIYDHENTYKIPVDQYSRGGEFVDNMVVDNKIEFCKRWFKLGGIKEVIEDIDEFYMNKGFGKYSNLINAGFGTGVEPAILPTNNIVEPAIIFDHCAWESPIYFEKNRPEELNYIHIKEKNHVI